MILAAVFDQEREMGLELFQHRRAVFAGFGQDCLDDRLALDGRDVAFEDERAVVLVIDPVFDGGAGFAED